MLLTSVAQAHHQLPKLVFPVLTIAMDSKNMPICLARADSGGGYLVTVEAYLSWPDVTVVVTSTTGDSPYTTEDTA